MSQPKAYLEHVAFWVRDIQWHIRFFSEVCGMTMREVQGDVERPAQYWTLGGLQFIHQPDFAGPEGRMAHLGIMCEDLEAALAAAQRFGVSEEPPEPSRGVILGSARELVRGGRKAATGNTRRRAGTASNRSR
jgi:catechol 2,3-dioxygenase-like lactoylglutathione lyase family enzyme